MLDNRDMQYEIQGDYLRHWLDFELITKILLWWSNEIFSGDFFSFFQKLLLVWIFFNEEERKMTYFIFAIISASFARFSFERLSRYCRFDSMSCRLSSSSSYLNNNKGINFQVFLFLLLFMDKFILPSFVLFMFSN